MSTQRPYRLLALSLAAAFLLFNIGLPIIVASCPMAMSSAQPICSMCNEGSNAGPKISRVIDRSCCATVIAAERNTTEFLQVVASSIFQHHDALVFVSPDELCIVTDIQFLASEVNTSPPPCQDVLLLTSSLLI